MDRTLIVLLISVLAYAAILYYLFVIRRWYDWGYNARAGIIVMLAMLAPVLVTALWQQHAAKDKLADYGIKVYPELGSSIGVSVGKIVRGETWVFAYDGEEATLLNYYRDARNRPGWSIASDNSELLILRREDLRLTIGRGDDSAIFQVYSRQDASP